ncbi:MAG: hypothetical protein J1E79_03980, partial [Rikenella sp.]|nr:hypothetical protein [Rikenella sp.]
SLCSQREQYPPDTKKQNNRKKNELNFIDEDTIKNAEGVKRREIVKKTLYLGLRKKQLNLNQ